MVKATEFRFGWHIFILTEMHLNFYYKHVHKSGNLKTTGKYPASVVFAAQLRRWRTTRWHGSNRRPNVF